MTMIYKLKFTDGRIDWCTASNHLHLLKSYDLDHDLDLQEVEELEEISDEKAASIMVKNPEYNPKDPEDSQYMPLLDFAGGMGNDFGIIASTELF